MNLIGDAQPGVQELDVRSSNRGCDEPLPDDAQLDAPDGSATVRTKPLSDGMIEFAFSRRIVCLAEPDGASAASYRSLQTHLSGHVRDGRRGLALCAPTADAGCTTTAVNLAIAFAQAGVKTLLVDANLHRPAIHDFIRPSGPVGGLSDMLVVDEGQRVDEIRREVRPRLSVLYAGRRRHMGRELIAGRSFKRVIDDCMRSFEITIVDTPALRESTDARHIAMAVRHGLIVARRDVTMVADVRRAAEDLAGDRVRLAGSFLTHF